MCFFCIQLDRNTLCDWYTAWARRLDEESGQLYSALQLIDVSLGLLDLREDDDDSVTGVTNSISSSSSSAAVDKVMSMKTVLEQLVHLVYECGMDPVLSMESWLVSMTKL